jgi:hypothetical protein
MSSSILKPWEIRSVNGRFVEDSFYIPLWKDYRPRSFIFSINLDKDGDCAVLHLVPQDFFYSKRTMFYDSIPITQYLPDFLEEVYEAAYLIDAETSIEAAKRDMIGRGFGTSKLFDQVINHYYSNNVNV